MILFISLSYSFLLLVPSHCLLISLSLYFISFHVLFISYYSLPSFSFLFMSFRCHWPEKFTKIPKTKDCFLSISYSKLLIASPKSIGKGGVPHIPKKVINKRGSKESFGPGWLAISYYIISFWFPVQALLMSYSILIHFFFISYSFPIHFNSFHFQSCSKKVIRKWKEMKWSERKEKIKQMQPVIQSRISNTFSNSKSST